VRNSRRAHFARANTHYKRIPMLQRFLCCALFLSLSSSAALAGNVRFRATGTVANASGLTGVYSGITAGQPAELVFEVTTPGNDLVPGHQTEYAIVSSSLQMTMGSVVVGTSSGTPTALMRNNDATVDGVVAAAELPSAKNLGFSFTSCNGTMFSSTDPEQNLGSWSGPFYCVYGWTVSGTGTWIEMDFTTFEIELPFTGDMFCFGDGTQSVACPCANNGLTGRGCDNSAATGGAWLTAVGTTSPDTLVFTASGELPNSLSVVLQGNQNVVSPLLFGDGLRCAGGQLKRLYIKNASGGVVSAPQGSEPSVSARSAALGDVIAPGATRYYQVYYRDPSGTFCAAPAGNTYNISNAVQIDW